MTSHQTPNGSGSRVGTSPRYSAIAPSVSSRGRRGRGRASSRRSGRRCRARRRRASDADAPAEPRVLRVRLDAVDADRHAEAAAVHRRSPPRAARARRATPSRRAMHRRPPAVVALALALRPRETERLPAAPTAPRSRARRRAARDRTPEEARLDRLAELDLALDDRAVGERRSRRPFSAAGRTASSRGTRLALMSKPVVVDEVEAPVAADAGRVELDRVDRASRIDLTGATDSQTTRATATRPRRGCASSRPSGTRPRAVHARRGSPRGSRAPSPPACRRRCRGRTGP